MDLCDCAMNMHWGRSGKRGRVGAKEPTAFLSRSYCSTTAAKLEFVLAATGDCQMIPIHAARSLSPNHTHTHTQCGTYIYMITSDLVHKLVALHIPCIEIIPTERFADISHMFIQPLLLLVPRVCEHIEGPTLSAVVSGTLPGKTRWWK